MKIFSLILFAAICTGFLMFQGNNTGKNTQEGGSIYTAEVKKVIDKKCYGCHSASGKSKDAKNALMWDSLPNLQKSKILATLDDIIKVLKKNEMPPENAVKNYPEMKLLPPESKLLQEWAEAKADSLLR